MITTFLSLHFLNTFQLFLQLFKNKSIIIQFFLFLQVIYLEIIRMNRWHARELFTWLERLNIQKKQHSVFVSCQRSSQLQWTKLGLFLKQGSGAFQRNFWRRQTNSLGFFLRLSRGTRLWELWHGIENQQAHSERFFCWLLFWHNRPWHAQELCLQL